MLPAFFTLLSCIGVALLYRINSIQHEHFKISKLLFNKFTVLLLFISVNSVHAQIKPTPAAERLNGLQKRKLLEEKSLLKNISFRNIGPVQMSGRVVDIEANPNDPTEFYVAYASGGLWYTNTNGLSLTPVFDNEDAFSIGDIAVKWNKTIQKGLLGNNENLKSNNEIWVGTGEVNSSRSSYSGTGVYKSSDNGKSWQWFGLPESHHIGKIVLHPTNNNIAWVAALGHLYSANKERGVYKTIDGGKTWKQTLFVDDNTGAVEMDINPIIILTKFMRQHGTENAGHGTWKESGKTSAIYKSTDGGDTWKSVTLPGSGFATGEKLGRIGVAVFQKNPNIVYAVIDNNNLKPDTAKKKIDSTKYNLDDFKNISKEKFAELNDKKLDSFLMRNNFDAKYTFSISKRINKK